ncbi:hypothetical protein DPMN_015845 [Dreissena polymorpha]|uniref:Uncharacterized protein n=1 Tax=Dreissena polymorpha TaxID=45954 RepID=A0A9D4N8J7_DREPO|nr:hypothetical protein DPMN_015845 [Dreissena polymorpha]
MLKVCRDVPPGTEVLVWYGDSYLQFMGIPVTMTSTEDEVKDKDADINNGKTGGIYLYFCMYL